MDTMRRIALAAVLVAGIAHGAEPIKASASDVQTQTNAVGTAMKMVAPVQETVAAYRRSHDGFPSSNTEAGIQPAPAFASDTVKRVDIGPDGVIDVTLTAASGVDDGKIRFRPEFLAQSGGGDVHWTCISDSIANIGDLTLGACEHTTLP